MTSHKKMILTSCPNSERHQYIHCAKQDILVTKRSKWYFLKHSLTIFLSKLASVNHSMRRCRKLYSSYV